MIINNPQDSAQEQFLKVPNAVIDRSIGEGIPVYLTVYLFALRQLEAGNTSVSNSRIAEMLGISDIDVVNAFLFYSSKGLIKIHNFTSVDNVDFDIEFCFGNIKASKTEFRPSYKQSEISRQLTDNPKVGRMYRMVSQIMGKTLSTADTELLYSLYDYYALPAEVILVLVEYYVSKGKRSMRTIEKEAAKWASSQIDTVEKARRYIKKREEFLSYAYRVRTIVGVADRSLSAKELEYINRWQNEFKMDFDMVKAAFELTVNQTGKLSFAYMNKILESWSKNNIRKKDDIVNDKKSATKKAEKSGSYNFAELEKAAMRRMMGGETDGV